MIGLVAVSTTSSSSKEGESAEDFIYNIQSKINDYTNAIQKELFGTIIQKESSIENYFKLPITYVEPKQLHEISNVVSTDLELAISENKCIYDCIFSPKHSFAKMMIPQWNKQFTSNKDYLEETQTIIHDMGSYKKKMSGTESYELDTEKISKIWKDIKNNPSFYDKYGFVEWNSLKYLNQSSYFLEILSIMNIMSPIMSLTIPFFILFFPFLILKIQGVPVTFSAYVEVLKHIARNHFIGKALLSMTEMTLDKAVYILFSFGMYLFQIYQNVTSCVRFYNNIKYVNDSLIELKSYVNYSIESMDNYLQMTSNCDSYRGFCKDVHTQCSRLKMLKRELEEIYPFSHSIRKFNDIGYMLKCFYELHTNNEYETALYFSMGFEGYINNLLGVFENISKKQVNFASFIEDGSKNTVLKKQYYPPLMEDTPVCNDCSFDKNIILSAPNKAGKTTVLKTTMINIILSQQIGCGFYTSCKIAPYTHIHSYLNIPDTSGRDSLFQAEARRCKDILDVIKPTENSIHTADSNSSGSVTDKGITSSPEEDGSKKPRHFCIFDELFSGTNPEEATKSAHAFLQYLSGFKNVDFMLTTHYKSVCKKFRGSKVIENYKMDVKVLDNGSFDYTYKMKKGISSIKGAVRVLKDMNYPKEILDIIAENPNTAL